jgi:hypothetical protein
MIREMSEAVEQYADDIQCILIDPERLPELLRELANHRWYNTETNEIIEGLPSLKDNTDANGALVRIGNIPVFEDRYLQLPIFTDDKRPILFYTRRCGDDGINLLQGWDVK